MRMALFQMEEGSVLPVKKTDGAAGYDVTCPTNFLLAPGRNSVPLNFRMSFGYDLEALIEPRSGFSLFGLEVYDVEDKEFKKPLRIDADVIEGKLDSDFRGIPAVIIKSCEKRPYIIKCGTRIAQLTFVKIEHPEIAIVDNLPETERSDNGFNSTGTTN